MIARGGAVLYTPDILALAVELAKFPLDDALPHRGEAHSRICGSRMIVGVAIAGDGTIERTGARASACAIGQAAAALFLTSAKGRDAVDIATTLAALEGWLEGDPALPTWPRIAQLEAARAYPARHAAILLPWRAALAALSNPALPD